MAADLENTLYLEVPAGRVVIEMRPDLAPKHCAQIKELVRKGFYDGIVFHRVIEGFMVQTGCPHGTGTGGSGKHLKAEFSKEKHLRGVCSMARAQDPNFDITLELDLERSLAPVGVVPQELTRVLLNLIGNGFYAASKRSRDNDGTYSPALKVMTREFGESVEVRVRDNGIGIPPEDRDKLFQPFFTTKPTGEGTGLGLSISYEIITQQHGGTHGR